MEEVLSENLVGEHGHSEHFEHSFHSSPPGFLSSIRSLPSKLTSALSPYLPTGRACLSFANKLLPVISAAHPSIVLNIPHNTSFHGNDAADSAISPFPDASQNLFGPLLCGAAVLAAAYALCCAPTGAVREAALVA